MAWGLGDDSASNRPRRRWVTLGLLALFAPGGVTPEAGAQVDAPAPAVSASTGMKADSAPDSIERPFPWFTWGGELRVRQEYIENAQSLGDDPGVTLDVFRYRGRLWVELGPSGGLQFYMRLAAEPYIFRRHPPSRPRREWNEIVWDNLFLNWQRIGGSALSLRIGREDFGYGRGWVLFEGTPTDAGRTIYSDVAVATVHLDEYSTDIDLFLLDNRAGQSRLRPISEDGRFVSEYDTRMFGTYVQRLLDSSELHAYYLYHDDDLVLDRPMPPRRIVHTLGTLVEGTIRDSWDYYVEGAYQWGRHASSMTDERMDRAAWGIVTDLGYTSPNLSWTPRLHTGYEYLSGNRPGTGRYEGWDAVLGRWPQWSELLVRRWGPESGVAGERTNLRRAAVGASAKPLPQMTLTLDYHLLFADTHPFGAAPPLSDGNARGHLVVSHARYDLSDLLSGHLWAEYLRPGDYYSSGGEDAVFLRWQITVQR